ncbi:MAG: ThuA domain-containing protein [Bryobacterales bacterium]|nr:ThuA domain-containing protein [Bryobacterales bacterium]
MLLLLRLAILMTALTAQASAARQILFVTHSAGFRHDSIPVAVRAMEDIGRRTGAFTVTATEDLSAISAAGLAAYDAVFLFTSGELALSDQQKRDLLAYVRSGKGFGGAHSATDTLYSWGEYGELIGAYFDGHPWVQEVSIDIEDPDFPGHRGVAPSFRMVEEIYQFREFSRDRVRVLQTLDTATVDLRAAGVNRADGDFALTWCRPYGQGRVFYTALGHFDETWRNTRFQQMLEGALQWLVGDVAANAAPRTAEAPVVTAVRTPDGRDGVQAPGALVRIDGVHLTSGSTFRAEGTGALPRRLAGTRVELDGRPLPLLSVAPERIEALLPGDLRPGGIAAVTVSVVNRTTVPVTVPIAAAAPTLLGGVRLNGALVLYATGLGEVTPAVGDGQVTPLAPLSVLRQMPVLRVNGAEATVFFGGLAPALIGVYQVNAMAGDLEGALEVELETAGVLSNRLVIPGSQTGSAADSVLGQ